MIRMIQEIPIEIEVLEHYGDLPLPEYQTEGSAGFDFYAAIDKAIELLPGKRILIPSGLKMAIPPGCELQVRPRSGLALKYGVTVLNSPGTVDSDYRGEIGIILINLGEAPFVIEPGMRIAQGIVGTYGKASFQKTEALTETCRGQGGFGHTGA